MDQKLIEGHTWVVETIYCSDGRCTYDGTPTEISQLDQIKVIIVQGMVQSDWTTLWLASSSDKLSLIFSFSFSA